ncbi:MAG: DUF3793 family protein [Acidaminococcaceae bacterium]|nr:DUF3793 family protein [Acidaminococcaceae bacterium]
MLPYISSIKNAVCCFGRLHYFLRQSLGSSQACALLAQRGYPCKNPEHCIAKLVDRLNEATEFPHEIGLFLGYPPEKRFVISIAVPKIQRPGQSILRLRFLLPGRSHGAFRGKFQLSHPFRWRGLLLSVAPWYGWRRSSLLCRRSYTWAARFRKHQKDLCTA